MITLKGNNAGYEGDSNDVKPTDVPVNTIFRELDTNCKYYFTGEAWVEIPGGGGGGGGGTDSYNDLENKPQINSVTLSGNKSLSALGIQAELTIDSTPTADSTNPVESGGVYEALALKQDTLTIDSTPTESSTNPVESGGVYTALGNKQNTITFEGTYNPSTNKAATESTVSGAISTAVGNLTKSDVGLDNVTNNAQIKAVSGGVTSGDIVTFGGDGATVQDSGKAIETALTDSDNKIPTSKSIIDNAAGAEKLTGYSADSAEANITASTTVTGAIEQLDYRTTLNKNNILSIHKAADLYFSETEPTGTIAEGSYWISTTAVQIASRTIQLYDKYNTDITNNKYIEQTGAEKEHDYYEITDYIPISPSTDYIWQFSVGEPNTYNAPSIAFYDSTKTLISGVVHESGVRYVTATSPANAAYIRCSVFKTFKDKAMLSQGTTEQTYKPYIEWT